MDSRLETALSESSQPPALTKSSTHPSGHVPEEAEVVVEEAVVVEGGGGDVGFVGLGFVVVVTGSSVVVVTGSSVLMVGAHML